MVKKSVLVCFLLVTAIQFAQETQGKVVSEKGVIEGAIITVKNTFTEAITNAAGEFSIKAGDDNVLVISYFGTEAKEVVATPSTSMTIVLDTDAELLDEVLIKAKKEAKEKTEETAYGKQNRDALGYSTSQTLTADQINQSYTNVFDIIRTMPGTEVFGLQGQEQSVIFTKNRSLNTALPIVVIDGAVFDQSILNAISPTQIVKIALLKSLNATLRYGQLGAGGAILITTQLGEGNAFTPEQKQASLLVKGNEYKENIVTIENAPTFEPYLLSLQKATNFEEAKNIYQTQRDSGDYNTIPYYVSVSDYFLKWDANFSFQVLSNIAKEASNNTKALRTYAYKLDERKEFLKSLSVYKRIVALRPGESQSYLDLAMASEATGDYDTAFALYYQIIFNTIPNVDCTGIQDIAINEIRHLLAFHKNKVPFQTLPNDFLAAKLKQDIRIVLQWNNPSKDFEVQFVSPENKFFIWNHTKFDNIELMKEEVEQGYAIKEYSVDEKSKGSWRVNIRALEEEAQKNPTYLKYTLYRNFGLTTETKQVKVVNLSQFTEKVTLDNFIFQ
ncbi:carboxypeptidase-like regulatory domain-containing protein [Rasiella sp. SM2506]|uniref:carboxypeptidase-like regulatory domain-containing protein n=1 Tax=Rasiella sp. SM2506 TaxID=3423914 RepID=UPI003D7A55F7